MSAYAMTFSVIILLALLFLKVPVFLSILSGAVSYFLMTPGIPTLIIGQRFCSGMESIPLLAVPFFICAGSMMNYAGVTSRIMDLCCVLTGRRIGGLAQVNVLLSTLMGGLSGSSLADAAMEAKMLVPEMEKHGYSKEFSSVVTAVSSMITPLIPPGIAMILFGSIASVSVAKLFISGIGIGVLLCAAMMVLVAFISKRRGYPPMRTEKMPWREALPIIARSALPLCLPIIIIGGIRIGVFTATEAGAVAVIYAMILGFAYRELNLKKILLVLKETVQTTSSILLIVGASSVFAWVLTREQIPQRLTEMMLMLTSNKYLFLLIINLFLLAVGMFIEGNAALIVIVPLLIPMARAFGIDDIHFAMIYIFNMSIGAITPPVGTLMFVTCGVTGCTIRNFMKESVSFYVMLFVVMLLITYIPFFSTFLVNLMY